ncbi:MAG: hypothetical protein U0S76_00335 [Pseudoxanthomonas sp.]|nr:hypothetical protein [Pseudoxanthomonas sp.]
MAAARVVAPALALALATSVAGCWGGGAEVRNSTRSTTVGQELIDLERAHGQGLLDQREYERQRRRILRRRD